MKVLQSVLLAALVVVLTAIAVDLHRLTAFVVPSSPAKVIDRASTNILTETREQRIVRMRREIDELAAVWAGVLEEPKPAPPLTGQKRDRSTH
jgi:hypothetical protein